jgi:hypothetical protein
MGWRKPSVNAEKSVVELLPDGWRVSAASFHPPSVGRRREAVDRLGDGRECADHRIWMVRLR